MVVIKTVEGHNIIGEFGSVVAEYGKGGIVFRRLELLRVFRWVWSIYSSESKKILDK